MEDEAPEFTMGDLLQELADRFGSPARADKSYEDIYTTREIATMFRVSRSKALKVIKEMYEEGRLEITRKKIERFGGGESDVQAYKLKITKGEDNDEQDQSSVHWG